MIGGRSTNLIEVANELGRTATWRIPSTLEMEVIMPTRSRDVLGGRSRYSLRLRRSGLADLVDPIIEVLFEAHYLVRR